MAANKFLRFSGMAVQMMATIALFTYGGVKLDERFETDGGWTAALALLGVVVSMLMVFRDLSKIK